MPSRNHGSCSHVGCLTPFLLFQVLFPLLTKLLDNISPADVGGMEETRMRACTLLSKVSGHGEAAVRLGLQGPIQVLGGHVPTAVTALLCADSAPKGHTYAGRKKGYSVILGTGSLQLHLKLDLRREKGEKKTTLC